MFYLASKLISSTLGFLFPAYASYKAIRNNDSHAIEVSLMYWVVMAGLHTVENTVEWAVNWFPFYYEIKSILIVWLTLPQIQGSTYVYVTYIHPFLLSHEDEIDATWTKAKGQAKAAGLDYMRRAWMAVREAVMGAILAPDDRQAAAALTGHAPARAPDAPAPAPKVDRPVPSTSQPAQRPAPASPSQQAWAFAGSMLRNYGPAALAAGHAVLHPLQSQSHPQAGNVSNEDAKRKKYDDLAASGISNRTYAQEMPRGVTVGEGGKRAVSAAATLIGGAGAAAQASSSSSAYSGYTRAQLRQRRQELERELASLETPIASRTVSHVYNEQDENDHDDMDSLRPYPPTSNTASIRSRHISAPTPPRHASSPSSSRPTSSSSVNLASGTGSGAVNSGLEGSLYEQIRREDIDNVHLPKDWGTRAQKQGWKGAPPTPSSSGNSVHSIDSASSSSTTTTGHGPAEQRPAAPAKRSSWFWHSSAPAPTPASGSADPASGMKRKD